MRFELGAVRQVYGAGTDIVDRGRFIVRRRDRHHARRGFDRAVLGIGVGEHGTRGLLGFEAEQLVKDGACLSGLCWGGSSLRDPACRRRAHEVDRAPLPPGTLFDNLGRGWDRRRDDLFRRDAGDPNGGGRRLEADAAWRALSQRARREIEGQRQLGELETRAACDDPRRGVCWRRWRDLRGKRDLRRLRYVYGTGLRVYEACSS